MDTRIYVMTHKKYVFPEDDSYIPLHVGREGKADLGYLGDHTGDNISFKNKNYCELTGLYWVWKNVDCDNVGICHYRRYFVRDCHVLAGAEVEALLKEYDLIIPNSGCSQYKNEYEHYAKQHYEKDLCICGDVLREKYPQYYPAFCLSLAGNLMSLGNMVITKKQIFDAYCQWLFDILFEVERRVDISDYDEYQARIMGFLSERLFRVWVMMSNYNVREEAVEMIESS